MSLERILSFAIMVSLILLSSSGVAAMPQIIGNVETEFGIYSPYAVDVVPDVPAYVIDPDLNTVTNSEKFTFTDSEKARLVQNGFVAGPTRFKQVYDVYNYCQENDIPIFVTSDSMLHTYHILFDYTLRILETRKFYGDLRDLNESMLEKAKAQYENAAGSKAKTAAKKNLAYFTVASVLLEPTTPIPPEVSDLVAGELELIDAHIGKADSPIFEYAEDYSQYVPRGHYTRSDELKRYFMSMMWYGRIAFRLKPREGIEKAKEETLQAILMVAAMKNVVVNGEPATDVWDRIYEPTVFFVGKTDDLNVYEYMELLIDIYGTDFASLSPDDLADDAKLEDFIAQALELRNPFINSSFVFEDETLEVTKGFRFMGQRFIPDSYMFQQLIHTAVTNRFFPKGLDVMAVLGSERAYDILTNVYNEDVYPKYTTQIEKLRGEFAGMDDEMWAQNLYWNWLYVLMSLLTPKEAGYPPFMLNQAWIDKDLATALGSWAELRHDTILYAKQSYAFETSIPEGPHLVKGYVEPNPEFYARLASLAKFTREGLSDRGLLLSEFAHKFTQLEDLLVSLKEISEIELEDNPLRSDRPGQSPSAEQYGIIMNIGGTLEDITTFPPDIAGEIENQEDDEMAIIADVSTDPNSARVLEEGVGYPLNIFVVVPVNGGLRIAQGAIFSYYEFTWPMSDRLTDGQWQDMLKTNPPKLPEWMASFIDLAGSLVTGERSSYAQDVAWRPTEMKVAIKPELIEIGTKIEVQTTIYGSPDSPPVITLRQDAVTARSEMKQKPDGFFFIEYTGSVDTKDFKPGAAQITINGRVGEEELVHTQEVNLQSATAVEGVGGMSTGAAGNSSLQNRAHCCYPNPFNPDVWIPYELNRNAQVTVEIYDAVGRLVRSLDLGYKFPGRYVKVGKAAHWDGQNSNGEQVSSGIYFYKLQAGDFIATGKMIAVK